MPITNQNYAALISQLSTEQKVSFYEILAHRLTVVCRGIWSDTHSTALEKVEAMRWLNEIQHRITAKIAVERKKTHEWLESDVIQMIHWYVSKWPPLKAHIGWAIESSYNLVRTDK